MHEHVNGSASDYRDMHGVVDHVFATGTTPMFVSENPRNPVPDYDDAGGKDWQTVGTTVNAFGACL